MKRLILAAAILAVSIPSCNPARAADHDRIGLGFRSNVIGTQNASEIRTGAPIGIRYWLENQKVGIDLGFGFATHKDVAANDNTSDWSIEGGIPFVLKSWDRAVVNVRPGVNYTSQEDFIPVADGFEKITDKFTTITGEVEAEVFLVQNVSVSASEGIGWVNYKPGEAGSKSTTDFTTFGQNFTRLGFHVYLWGS